MSCEKTYFGSKMQNVRGQKTPHRKAAAKH